MFNGKNKAVTFSYDDGVRQDIRFIKILDKYGLKATFNINSGLLGTEGKLTIGDKMVDHSAVTPEQVAEIYKNHEVAVHTLTHPNLTTLDDDEIIRQVNDDQKRLSELCGYKVHGMAYPCGGVNNNDHVADVIKNNTSIIYARTITSTYSFELQDNLLRFNPTVYHMETEKMFELCDKFLNSDTQKPQLFYIWGHSYELDLNNGWDAFEKLCEKISGHDDIFYGTNTEVFNLAGYAGLQR